MPDTELTRLASYAMVQAGVCDEIFASTGTGRTPLGLLCRHF